MKRKEGSKKEKVNKDVKEKKVIIYMSWMNFRFDNDNKQKKGPKNEEKEESKNEKLDKQAEDKQVIFSFVHYRC